MTRRAGRNQWARGRGAAAGVLAAAGLWPRLAGACAACYGQSDSPMAAGMNWGILSLLVMIGLVLGGVAGFFVFLARRASAGGGAAAANTPAAALAAVAVPEPAVAQAAPFPDRNAPHEPRLAARRHACAPPARAGRDHPTARRSRFRGRS